MNSINELHDAMLAAGVPVKSVGQKGLIVDAVLASNASREQIAKANELIASFDARKRKPREVGSLTGDISKLSEDDRETLLNLMVAKFLIDNPQAAKKAGVEIAGDEVDE